MRTITKLWIGLGVLMLISPLGLLLPERFQAGDAWGEWGTDSIRELVGYIPLGLEKLSSAWSALIPDYAFKGWGEKGLAQLSFAYIVSAFIGICVTAGAVLLIGRLLSKKE
ncbi:MAG: PDGLE domain-containing protein [Candidatus Omnitrophota bacterium]